MIIFRAINFRAQPQMFRPLSWRGKIGKREPNAVPQQPDAHAFIVRDLSMPARDWSAYDAIAKGRFVSERKRARRKRAKKLPSNVTPISALLRRQAQ